MEMRLGACRDTLSKPFRSAPREARRAQRRAECAEKALPEPLGVDHGARSAHGVLGAMPGTAGAVARGGEDKLDG